jgi:SEC-C motif
MFFNGVRGEAGVIGCIHAPRASKSFNQVRRVSPVLIRRGFNAKVVSDRLGHTSVAFTMQKYVHLFDEQRREAAISMADFLGVDVQKSLEDQNVSSVPCPCGSGKMFHQCHGFGISGAWPIGMMQFEGNQDVSRFDRHGFGIFAVCE